MRANTVSLQGWGEETLLPLAQRVESSGRKAPGAGGLSLPRCLEGILASGGGCSAVATGKAGWSTMSPVDPSLRARGWTPIS